MTIYLLAFEMFANARRVLIYTSSFTSIPNMTEFLSNYDFAVDPINIDVHKVSTT